MHPADGGIMTAREALLRIAERALAQRDAQAFQSAEPCDRLDKLNYERSQLLFSRKLKDGRILTTH